jgi:hypothetical protein
MDNPEAEAIRSDAILAQSARDLQAIQAAGAAGPQAGIGMQPDPNINYALTIPDAEASSIVSMIDEEVTRADEDRASLLRLQRDGIKRLGIDRTVKSRSEPFEGASVVVHPAMMQCLLDFQAMAVRELAPLSGPAREERAGNGTELSAILGRVINRALTKHSPEWRNEFDRLLMLLPLEGSSFKKVYEDRGRPKSVYVGMSQVIMPYSESGEPGAVPFICHQMYVTRAEINSNIGSGLWKPHDPLFSAAMRDDEVRDEADKVIGQTISGENRAISGQFKYREVQVYTSIPQTGIPEPMEWILTYDSSSMKLVALRTNAKPDGTRIQTWVHYRMFPWLGAYGIGFAHTIGGLTDAQTGAMRSLLDGAQIKSMPGGLFLGDDKNAEAIKMGPMRWHGLKRPGSRDIREMAMPFPYDGPSPVLFQLLEFLTGQSKEFASVSLQRMADAQGGELPAATMLTMVEGGAKVYSAIHARLLGPLQQELDCVRDVLRDGPPEFVQMLLAEIMGEEAQKVDVAALLSEDNHALPVSSTDAPSATHRIAKAQASLDLVGKAISIGVKTDNRRAIMQAAQAQGLPDAQLLFPVPEQFHGDPYTETIKALQGVTLTIDPNDNHVEHIKSHMGVGVLPGIPQTPGGQTLIMHSFEHCAALAAEFEQRSQQHAMLVKQGDPQAMQTPPPMKPDGKPITALDVFLQAVSWIAPAMQAPDPTMALAEVERTKVQEKAKADRDRIQLAYDQIEAKQEELEAELTAKIRLEREQMQANVDEAFGKLQAKLAEIEAQKEAQLQIAREANASQERRTAADITAKQQVAQANNETRKDVAKRATPGVNGRPKPKAKPKG